MTPGNSDVADSLIVENVDALLGGRQDDVVRDHVVADHEATA